MFLNPTISNPRLYKQVRQTERIDNTVSEGG